MPLANMNSYSPTPSFQPLHEECQNDATTPKPNLLLNEINDDSMIPLRTRIKQKADQLDRRL